MTASLVDHRGKPVQVSRLRREQATASSMSVRTPYDPLVAPGLTPQKLQDMLARANQGDHADYLQLAHEMERRDGNYFSALQTRRLAVQQLERTVEAPSEDENDAKVSAAIKSWLFSPAFGKALLHVLDATSKGFSIIEIIWARSEELWKPVEFKMRPQRWFFFERERAEELRLHNGSPDGEALEPFKYLVHVPFVLSGTPLGGGLARVVAALHLFKGYALKDWMAFAEVFGMPIRIGKYEQGASDQDKEELRRAITEIGSDAAALIPSTMEIVFERASGSGFAGSDEFFKTLTNWCNREVNKTVLGSNFVDEDGGSFAKAIALNELRKDLRNSDAWQVADTIQRDLVVPFVDLNFGKRPREEDYPLVNFDTGEPEDLLALSKSLIPFIQVGLPVSVKTILEKFGLTMPEGDEPILRAPEPVSQDEQDDDSKPAAKLAEAQALLARISGEAERSTNMRAFRRELRGLVAGAC